MKGFSKRSVFLWALALAITGAAAVYQRRTGPTYPVSENIDFAGQNIKVALERSHAGPGDQQVSIAVGDTAIIGELMWRRYPTDHAYSITPMRSENGTLMANLPHQPPAGKLEYRIRLLHNGQSLLVPADETVVTRFRGDVPAYFLVPHILIMFLAMAYSNRAGIEALAKGPKIRYYTLATTTLLLLGGMMLGPIVQKYSFGAFWTGVPFGYDLTDNKTLIAFVAWIIVLVNVRKRPNSHLWVLIAALLTLIIYLIPHSLLGSELKYE